MFDIKLIRKMFMYEKINKKQFNMKNLKQLLQIDSNLINQINFKKWIDDNSLLAELEEWLRIHDLEKTFSEVYVANKTSVEEFVDFISNYGGGITQEAGSTIAGNFLDKERKKNKDMFK